MFDENLDALFLDFGAEIVAVVGPTTYTFKGILDMPDQIIGGLAQSTEYLLTVKTSDIQNLTEDQNLTVDGASYRLRGPFRKIDDGILSRVELTKL